MRLPPPTILKSMENSNESTGIEFLGKKYLLNEIEGDHSAINEEMLGRPMQRLALAILHDVIFRDCLAYILKNL